LKIEQKYLQLLLFTAKYNLLITQNVKYQHKNEAGIIRASQESQNIPFPEHYSLAHAHV
jgi:hypothetical protein